MFSQRLPTALNLKESFKTEYYIRASHTRGSFLFQNERIDFSMQLVIAEKPSVGVALAKALGVTEKKDG